MTKPSCAPSAGPPSSPPARGAGARLAALTSGLGAMATWGIVVGTGSDVRADEAEAAQKSPLSIKVLLASRTDTCFDSGDVGAIKRLSMLEADRINEPGGIAGRKIRVEFLDDGRDSQRAVSNVRSALADPEALALIGLSNPERAKAVFDALGNEKPYPVPLQHLGQHEPR